MKPTLNNQASQQAHNKPYIIIKMRFFFIFLVSCILLAGCFSDKETQETLGTIVISHENIQKRSNLDDIILDSPPVLIKLESNKDAMIQEISKLIPCGDSLIVADKKTNRLLLFDGDGRFIRSIGNHGRGPDEYVDLTDVHVFDNIITVYDVGNRKIIEYDFEGRAIRNFPIPMSMGGYSFVRNPKGFLLFRKNEIMPENSEYNLVFIDDQGVFKSGASAIPKQLENKSLGNNNNLTSFEKDMFAIVFGDNKIYQVRHSEGQITPLFDIVLEDELDMKKKDFWKQGISDLIDFNQELTGSGAIFWISDLIVNEERVLFTYFSKNNSYLCMFRRDNGNTIIVKNPSITREDIPVKIIANQRLNFYSVVQEGNISDKLKKVFPDEDFGPEDNPVLIKFPIK